MKWCFHPWAHVSQGRRARSNPNNPDDALDLPSSLESKDDNNDKPNIPNNLMNPLSSPISKRTRQKSKPNVPLSSSSSAVEYEYKKPKNREMSQPIKPANPALFTPIKPSNKGSENSSTDLQDEADNSNLPPNHPNNPNKSGLRVTSMTDSELKIRIEQKSKNSKKNQTKKSKKVERKYAGKTGLFSPIPLCLAL